MRQRGELNPDRKLSPVEQVQQREALGRSKGDFSTKLHRRRDIRLTIPRKAKGKHGKFDSGLSDTNSFREYTGLTRSHLNLPLRKQS
ncbi:MAG TPA: hypothetical protein V6D18_18750 [Thermosynechococcaceae cyanobacterium]